MTQYNMAHGHNQILGQIDFAHAEGPFIYDINGKEYIGLYHHSCLPLGHDSSILRKTFSKNHPLNVGLYPNSNRKLLTEALSKLFPQYSSFQFDSTGTSANEGMMRYAMGITGRSSFCGFECSFHGRSKALASVSDMDPFHGRRIEGYFQLPYPGYDQKTEGYHVDDSGVAHPTVEELTSMIDEHGYEDLAGMILEPIASKPLIEPPKGWLRRVKEEVLKPRGILLLADEYLTAGRTGSWLECYNQDVRPDVMSFGKCLTSGMPFSGIACLENFSSSVSIVKGSSAYGGQSPVCENVLLTINAIMEQNLIERQADLAQVFMKNFSHLKGSHGVERVFAKGALFGIEFSSKELALKVGQTCLQKRVLLAAIKRAICLSPPFNIDLNVLQEACSRIYEAIDTCSASTLIQDFTG